MNPTNPSKPVMDVSAPRSPQPPVADAPRPEPMGVKPAPPSSEPAHPVATPAPLEMPAKAAPKTKNVPLEHKTGAPVGVITVAVLVMMLLSAAAVIVYVTSQTA